MNKQIEEMAKDICLVKGGCDDVCNPIEDCRAFKYSRRAYEKGYRKASEVAREVIDNILSKIRTMIREIEKVERNGNSYFSEFNGGSKTALEIVFKDLAELKKKYESEGGE